MKRAMSGGLHCASSVPPYFFFSAVFWRSIRIQVSLRTPIGSPSWFQYYAS
jgi:hypothetical protein